MSLTNDSDAEFLARRGARFKWFIEIGFPWRGGFSSRVADVRGFDEVGKVLEPETKSDEDLLESLKQSVAGSASGDAEKKTHTLVWYDQADAGEAQVQPHLRVPGLRNRGGHLQRFVRLVRQRKDPNQDLDPRDIYALCDCGKDGNKGRLIGAFCLAPGVMVTRKSPCVLKGVLAGSGFLSSIIPRILVIRFTGTFHLTPMRRLVLRWPSKSARATM